RACLWSRVNRDCSAVPEMRSDRRLAWWLVWAYPPRFRRDVGLGLVDALEDRMRARRAAGSPAGVIWLRACLDTLRNASAEWMDAVVDAYRESKPSHESQSKGRTMIDKLRQDLRYAIRTWTKRPAVALVAILTLAIGIGANTAMFSIVNAVLLRPLPFTHADRLVSVWGVGTGAQALAGNPHQLVSYQEYREITRQSTSFDAIGLWFGQSVNLTGVSEPQRLIGSFVSGSFFDVLSLRAERGRLFTEEDTMPGTVKPYVVISHNLWQQRFDGKDS